MKSSNTSRPCRFQLSRSQSYILQANNADLCSHGLFSFLSFFLFFFFFSFLSFFFFFWETPGKIAEGVLEAMYFMGIRNHTH